jgi:ferritin
MISRKMEKAINEQINAELYSAYLYLAMAAHFQALNLPGFANWMRVQTQEETAHAIKFYDFVLQRGGRVTMTAIAAPPVKWDSPLAAFQHTYEHETKVTERINQLTDAALAEKDHATHNFLQWFISEQVEEEANANQLVQKLTLMGNDKSALFMLDRELAARVFINPLTAAGAAGA